MPVEFLIEEYRPLIGRTAVPVPCWAEQRIWCITVAILLVGASVRAAPQGPLPPTTGGAVAPPNAAELPLPSTVSGSNATVQGGSGATAADAASASSSETDGASDRTQPPLLRRTSPPVDPIDLYEDRRGIVVIPDNEQDKLGYSLILNGRFQARYTHFRDHGPFENIGANEFEMERVRLGFRGFVYAPYLQYNIGTDWDSDGAGGTANDGGLLHAFLQTRLEDAIGIGWGNRTSLRAGIWRTNFGRQVVESSKRLQFVDRSLTSAAFNLGTNAGVALIGEFVHNYRPVRYELALLNGFGTGSNRPRTQLDTNMGVALRATEMLYGDYEPGEGDNLLSEFPSLRVGFSFAYTHRTRRGKDGAASEFDNAPAVLMVTDEAAGIPFFPMDQLRGAEREYDLWLWGVEADWKRCGWSFHTEYLFRSIDSVRFESDNDFRDFTHGFYVQGGYFITQKVELVARHSAIFARGGGTGSPIRADYANSAHATGGGVNFYFRDHYSKFQIDAFYYDGAPISASSLNVMAGDRGLMLRAQYQFAF